MDAFKGVFRRATQAAKEKIGSADATEDSQLAEIAKKIRLFEKTGVHLSDKITRISRNMEELMTQLKEFGDSFKQITEPGSEMSSLADELMNVANESQAKVAELQKGLRDSFDNIGAFLREVPKLKEVEEDRKKKQLEFDFFKTKVAELKKSPPKDYTRIPRNEGILENWRVELWKSTENCKAVASGLYIGGMRCLDVSAYTVAMTLSNLWNAQLQMAKLHFVNARLPVYPAAPVLQPSPLPPNPFPPWVPPAFQQQVAQPGAQPAPYGVTPGAQPPAWGQPPPQQPYGGQPPAQGSSAPPPPWGQQQQQPYPPSGYPHGQYPPPSGPAQPGHQQAPAGWGGSPQHTASPPGTQQYASPQQQQYSPGQQPQPYYAQQPAPAQGSSFAHPPASGQSFSSPDGAVAPPNSFATGPPPSAPAATTATDPSRPPPPPTS